MNPSLVVLQSGFVARRSDLLVFDANTTHDPMAVIKAGIDIKSTDPGYYSPVITQHYTDYMSSARSLKDFDFREEVLKTAIKYIGDNFDLFRMQDESEYLSASHRLFILDTLKKRLIDGTRLYNIQMWINIIKRSGQYPKDNTFKNSVDDAIKGYKDSKYLDLEHNKLISYVIGDWVSKADGFSDLLTSLYIIFGKRG